MSLNPPTQYTTDANLRARQRLWEQSEDTFDFFGWVLGLADIEPGDRVLDVGCGNGQYLVRLRDRDVDAVGCDLSVGMLRAARPHPALVNGDVQRLPFPDDTFDVVLAPHMLYHVPDRQAAARELRRVLRAGGRCVAVTNGAAHMRSLRALVEAAAQKATPGWTMYNPSTHVFSLDNGAEQLAAGFESVRCVKPEHVAPVSIRDASIVADYVASVADHYGRTVDRPWSEIVDEVRAAVKQKIAADGQFTVAGESGAFVCS